ncbi:SCO1860 family LAETG-anchored protein [Streptomyces sp. bgisy027]|uniref:SCO1860 family LAETG-anchored protein n=1 Tax=Streptomyces sp. bgisy027 TaxID=3413770 RepID=UPI003D71D701
MTGLPPLTAYARCIAALTACGFLMAGPALTAEAAAVPTTDRAKGTATAAALRAELDVSRLEATGTMPLRASLNEVQARATAEKKTLDVTLDDVNGDRPVHLLRADVALARADVAKGRAEGTSHLVRARIHLPGLPMLSLLEVEDLTATATCLAGQEPAATSEVVGPITALGQPVSLAPDHTATVEAPGLGTVRLSLSRKEVTSSTSAATSLQLQVSADPLKLGVAKVEGTVTLAQATCRSPQSASDSPAPSATKSITPAVTHTKEDHLAKTGRSRLTPYILATGAVLVTAGATAMALTRIRRRHNP